MDSERLATEAETCRRLAKSYEGRPEQPFLLKAAALFDDLAEPRSSGRDPCPQGKALPDEQLVHLIP